MAEVQEHEQILRRYVAEMVLESDLEGLSITSEEGAGAPRGRSGGAALSRDGQQPSRGARGAPAEPRRRYRRAERTAVPALFGASAGEEDGEWTRKVSNVLRDDYTAFNHAAISYAALCEMGFRLYNPPLREIALRHLRAYAEATQQINQLIASVVAGAAAARVGVPLHMPHVQHGCLRLRGGRHLDGERGVARDGARWEAERGFLLLPPRAGSPSPCRRPREIASWRWASSRCNPSLTSKLRFAGTPSERGTSARAAWLGGSARDPRQARQRPPNCLKTQ